MIIIFSPRIALSHTKRGPLTSALRPLCPLCHPLCSGQFTSELFTPPDTSLSRRRDHISYSITTLNHNTITNLDLDGSISCRLLLSIFLLIFNFERVDRMFFDRTGPDASSRAADRARVCQIIVSKLFIKISLKIGLDY